MPDVKIGKTGKVDENGTLQPPDPGALEKYSDDTWAFTGDGSISTQQVASVVLTREAEMTNDPALKALERDPETARFLAYTAMAKNPALPRDPSDPVPMGQLVEFDGGASLKQLLAPFVNNFDKLKALVQGMDSSVPGTKNKYTNSGVGAGSLTLPID